MHQHQKKIKPETPTRIDRNNMKAWYEAPERVRKQTRPDVEILYLRSIAKCLAYDLWVERHEKKKPEQTPATPATKQQKAPPQPRARKKQRPDRQAQITLPPFLIHPSFDKIMCAVANATGVPADAIQSDRRAERLTDARHVFCYLAWAVGGRAASLAGIGRWLGRDHSTVLHSKRRVESDHDLMAVATFIATRNGWLEIMRRKQATAAKSELEKAK